jgi:hypothetical protein
MNIDKIHSQILEAKQAKPKQKHLYTLQTQSQRSEIKQ